MKKILIILLLIALKGQSQTPINYTKINQRYDWLSGKFDSTLHVPFGSSPSIRGGGYNWPGAVFLDTLGVDSGLYYFNRGWVQVGKNYLAGTGLTLTTTTFKVDTVPIATRLRVQKGIDSLGALIAAGSAIDPVLALGGSFTANRAMNLNGNTFSMTNADNSHYAKFSIRPDDAQSIGAFQIEGATGDVISGHNAPLFVLKQNNDSSSVWMAFFDSDDQDRANIGYSNVSNQNVFTILTNGVTDADSIVPINIGFHGNISAAQGGHRFMSLGMSANSLPPNVYRDNKIIMWRVPYTVSEPWLSFDLLNRKILLDEGTLATAGGELPVHGYQPVMQFNAPGVSQPITFGGLRPVTMGARVGISSVTAGGLLAQGYTDADFPAIRLGGHLGVASPTLPAVVIEGFKTDGADSRTTLAAGEKVISVYNGAYDAGTQIFSQTGDGTTTLSKYAGTGTRLPNVSSTGVLGAITNGSDGQVMTLVSGAPAWAAASGSSTTINNNANNRLITGSGTANTLEGEAALTYDGSILASTATQPLIYFQGNGSFSQPVTFGGILPTTLAARIGLNGSTYGGLLAQGFTSNDNPAFRFAGHNGSASPTVSPIIFESFKTDGADGRTTLAAGEKVFELFNGAYDAGTSVLKIIGDGGTTLGGYAGTGDDLAYFNSAGKFVRSTTEITNVATLASPTFTGTPAAPTAAPGTNTTQIATAAFVTTAVTNATLSGSYTPTLFNTTNVAASTAYTCYWYRVNDMVYVFGEVDIDPTTTLTATELGFSLPPGANASNLADDGELSGTAASAIAAEAIAILGDVTNDRASIKYLCTDISNHTLRIHFSYKVTPP